MMQSPPDIRVLTAPLAPAPAAFSAAAGAVLEFHGVVRGQEDAEPISGIGYEAHTPMARHQLELLAAEAAERFPILELVLHHRIGFVPVGEPSLFLRVSSEHRAAVFQAGQWLIDELKVRVPIWKHPAPIQATAGVCASDESPGCLQA